MAQLGSAFLVFSDIAENDKINASKITISKLKPKVDIWFGNKLGSDLDRRARTSDSMCRLHRPCKVLHLLT